MRIELFRLESYIPRSESFHFAHKTLDARIPGFLHRHDYFEWFMVETGELRHWTSSGQHLLEAGHMVCIRPDDAHAVQAVVTPCRIINIMLWPETIRDLARQYGRQVDHCAFWNTDDDPEQVLLEGRDFLRFQNAALALSDSPRTQLQIDQFVLSVASVMQIVGTSSIKTGDLPPWLTQAIRAARRPDVFRDGAGGLVRVSGRGHETVCRAFRRHLGQSPTEFINDTRMDFAALQLQLTDLSIEEIGRSTGIENLSHFYRLFRKRHDDTPRRFRDRRRRDPVQPLK